MLLDTSDRLFKATQGSLQTSYIHDKFIPSHPDPEEMYIYTSKTLRRTTTVRESHESTVKHLSNIDVLSLSSL